MSGLVNLTLSQTGLSYSEYFRHSWERLLLGLLVCSIAYGVVGFFTAQPSAGSGSALADITGMFRQSPFLWLLPLMTFGLALRGIHGMDIVCRGIDRLCIYNSAAAPAAE